MDLGSLKYAPGSVKKRKKIGRGQGSGHGGTSTRGHKGQGSRSGSKKRAWFEGGQMPLQRRVPKRGFTNIFKKQYQVVNIVDLGKLKDKADISPAELYESRLISKKRGLVKILGVGDIAFSINVSAHAFSESAKLKIEKAGGKVTLL